jgi:hypothetical protein
MTDSENRLECISAELGPGRETWAKDGFQANELRAQLQ